MDRDGVVDAREPVVGHRLEVDTNEAAFDGVVEEEDGLGGEAHRRNVFQRVRHVAFVEEHDVVLVRLHVDVDPVSDDGDEHTSVVRGAEIAGVDLALEAAGRHCGCFDDQ